LIFDDPKLETVFANRHQSDADMNAHRSEFNIGVVHLTIAKYDQKLADNFKLFYQRAIDFGGHPNPHGTFSAMELKQDGGNTEVMTYALSTDPKAIAHALKSVAQVGLTALYVFQHIFKARFELLGLRTQIDAIRQTGNL
jgi:hypothetical protein